MNPENGDSANDSGGMSDGTFFAIAILLFILAFVAWFVALHPNGLKNPDGTPVENAAEVIVYFMNKLTGGETSATAQTVSSTTSTGSTTAS
jgi:hypothetical protein